MADGEESAVIALWHSAGLTRPWNDPAGDLAFARGKAELGRAGGRDGRGDRGVRHGRARRASRRHVLRGVDPDRQGHGLGRKMVAAAEAWLFQRGVWKVNLMVRQGNEAVLGFYDGLGYGRSSSVVMEKWIDPGSAAAGEHGPTDLRTTQARRRGIGPPLTT